jgi:hypothetical protein
MSRVTVRTASEVFADIRVNKTFILLVVVSHRGDFASLPQRLDFAGRRPD